MRLTRIAMLIAAATSLAACQTVRYVKPGATPADYERDRLLCEYEAKKNTPFSNSRSAIGAGIEEGWREGQLIAMCMSVHGWTRAGELPE